MPGRICIRRQTQRNQRLRATSQAKAWSPRAIPKERGIYRGLGALRAGTSRLYNWVRRIMATWDEAKVSCQFAGGEARTSRDAGPYLARRVFAGGWWLAVGGWGDESTGTLSTPYSVICTLSA